MKKIVLAIAAAALATSALATPPKSKCGICDPMLSEVEQFEPTSPEGSDEIESEETVSDSSEKTKTKK
jgi:hypothetical protein